jgi:hypothetical protein
MTKKEYQEDRKKLLKDFLAFIKTADKDELYKIQDAEIKRASQLCPTRAWKF